MLNRARAAVEILGSGRTSGSTAWWRPGKTMPGVRSEAESARFCSCLPSLMQSHAKQLPTAGGRTTIGNARLADDKTNKPC